MFTFHPSNEPIKDQSNPHHEASYQRVSDSHKYNQLETGGKDMSITLSLLAVTQPTFEGKLTKARNH